MSDAETDTPAVPRYAGGCFCRAVRYAARGAPINVRVCHCRICQRVTGAPFFARALFLRDTVRVVGRTDSVRSSDRLARHFCPACGTSLFALREEHPPRIAVALATLDDPAALAPTMHIFTATQVPWLVLGDGLPRYPEGAP